MIRGVTSPRLDAWRRDARQWWAGRSRREQALLAVLALVIALAGIVILLIRPLQAARAAALADLRTYDAVQARILASGPAPAIPLAHRTGDVATIVAASASSFGIVVTDVAPVGRATRLMVAPIGYDALIHWLADLARTSNVRVDRLIVTRATPAGKVAAALVLSQ